MAHQYEPALDAATGLVQLRANRQRGAWRLLADYLIDVRQNPVSFERVLPVEIAALCDDTQRLTLALLDPYPRVALCELAAEAPAESQEQLFGLGLDAAGKSCAVAESLQDLPMLAFARALMASGYQELPELEAARASYDEALAIYRELAKVRPEVYRSDVAMTLNNLGTVQRDLNDLEAARASYDEARELYEEDARTRPTARIVERQRCWTNLGRLVLRDRPSLGWPDRHAARDAFRQGLQCAEAFRGRFAEPKERQRVQGEAIGLYDLTVRTCLEIWDEYREEDALWEAVEVAEASRARNLMELLADETLQPANSPPHLVAEFRDSRRRLRQAERRLQHEDSRGEAEGPPESSTGGERRASLPARSASRLLDAQKQVEVLGEQYRQRLTRIQKEYDREFDPDRPVPPIDHETLRQLLPDDVPTAIVQYTLTGERGLAVVITAKESFAVALPDLTDRQAWELMRAWIEGYYAHRAVGTWHEELPALLEPVAERAVRPIVKALEDRGFVLCADDEEAGRKSPTPPERRLKRLILSPNRALHVFPLHACRLEGEGGRHLIDACEVVYTPSLSILHRCATRQRAERSQLFLAENPTYDLPFTEVEGASLRKRFPSHTRLHGAAATREDILARSRDCHVFDYTGHASFNWEDPLSSALKLIGQPLTLRDIFCGLHLRENVLTVINGCESGMQFPDNADKFETFASGFLYAGATCVLSTLWSVWDISSALLVDKFFAEWQGGKSIAAALRIAQRWLRDDIKSGPYLRDQVLPGLLAKLDNRDLRRQCEQAGERYAYRFPDRPPFATPDHWAPFAATGLSYPLALA